MPFESSASVRAFSEDGRILRDLTMYNSSVGRGNTSTPVIVDPVLYDDEKNVSVPSNFTIAGTTRTTKLQISSDRRLKIKIKNLNLHPVLAQHIVRSIQAKTFIYQSDASQERVTGFIAQELLELFPECVRRDPSGFYSVDPMALIALLVTSQQSILNDVAYLKQTSYRSKVKKLFGCFWPG